MHRAFQPAAAEVPEGAEGGVNCYNMIGSDDGTLWMLVNVYATQYELPDDFDPNTDSKWNYPSTDINGSYLMHIAADGSTIASLDLSDTNNEDNEDGMSGNLSSFAVDAAGNLYVSDYNNIYVLDAEGNVQFKLDGSQYNGSLCRLNAQQVGVMWYNYTDDVNAADENGQYFVPIDLETKDWGEKVKLPSNVGTSSRATMPMTSTTPTIITSMAMPPKRTRRRSSSTGWPATLTPTICRAMPCSPTAAWPPSCRTGAPTPRPIS